MFNIGEMVFYPLHGVGVIETIEEKEILGETKLYYVLNITHKNIRIMIPTDSLAASGMRDLIDSNELDEMLSKFYQHKTDPNIYNNQRYCTSVNKSKIKSGDVYQICEIIRDLTRKGKKTKLGNEDRAILEKAREVFISEIAQVKGIDLEQANDLLDCVINSADMVEAAC